MNATATCRSDVAARRPSLPLTAWRCSDRHQLLLTFVASQKVVATRCAALRLAS